jgi:predicted nucleotide-binding protein
MAMRQTRQVFVAYPYSFPRRDYRRVFKSLGESFQVKFVFADEQIVSQHIMEKIDRYIQGSDFSLFDISGWNPNVALELGMAYGRGSAYYILYNPAKNAVGEVPSNLRGIDRIQYADYADLEDKLAVLLQQRYPQESGSRLEEYHLLMQEQVREFVFKHPGRGVVEIAER